eukprot:SAG11_NODE_16838_length_536_cov_0.590389_1_plen_68_part_10
MGFYRRSAQITIDLDSSFCLSKVMVSVGLGGSGMIMPKSIDVSLSEDGEVFSLRMERHVEGRTDRAQR